MKKSKNSAVNHSISQFQFKITPVSVNFNQKSAKNYFLYIEKGAQVLGKIEEYINDYQQKYTFTNNQGMSFRVSNQKSLTYQWSIYKYDIQCKGEEYFIEIVDFNLKKNYEEFLKQFESIEEELYRIYNQKEKKMEIQQIWKNLRDKLMTKQFQMTSQFSKIHAILSFKIFIKTSYDFMYDKWIFSKQNARFIKQSRRNLSSDSMVGISQIIQTISQKQKLSNSNQSSQKIIETEVKNNSLLQKDLQNSIKNRILDSQIKILDPSGADVTGMPQKFILNRAIDVQDFDYLKKSSMLSDILEQSYQGSTNFNIKSSQGQRIKSLDQIHEQQQPIFSPMVKTQSFDSAKYYEGQIKRRSTLMHKSSQEMFGFERKKDGFRLEQVGMTDDDDIDELKMFREQKKVQQQQTEGKQGTMKNIFFVLLVVIFMGILVLGFNDNGNKVKKYGKENKKGRRG